MLGLAVLVLLLIALSWWMGQQAYHWLPVQASTAAPLVDGLFSFETAIGTFVFGGVVSVMAWVLLMHRAEKYDETDAEPIEGNTKLEVIWTAIQAGGDLDGHSVCAGDGHRRLRHPGEHQPGGAGADGAHPSRQPR